MSDFDDGNGLEVPPKSPQSLRTRIACVLAGITLNNTPKPEYLEMADAVIEALDLGIPCASDGCRIRQIARRSAEKLGLTGDGE